MVKRALLAFLLIVAIGSVARAEKYSISAGTTLHCRLTQTLSTKLNSQGDLFTATVSEPLIINGRQLNYQLTRELVLQR